MFPSHDHWNSKNRLSIVEKVFVGLLWPWAIYKIVSEYYKVK